MKVGSRLPIFRSPEQERLPGELFVFADSPISLSELRSRAGTFLGGTHKEVERLEAAGLVTSTVMGRNRLMEADRSSPVYLELRGLLLKTLGPEALLRKGLANIDGIQEAFIYGSWADPAEKSPADIEVLVVGAPDVGEVYDAASAVETEVGRPVNITVRSPTEWAEADGAFERTVKTLDELNRHGLIEVVEVDPATSTQWLDDSERHLGAATKFAGLDPSGAYLREGPVVVGDWGVAQSVTSKGQA